MVFARECVQLKHTCHPHRLMQLCGNGLAMMVVAFSDCYSSSASWSRNKSRITPCCQ